jgi:hypothetical protein
MSKRLKATDIFINTDGRVHINYLLLDITRHFQVFKHYNSPFLRFAGTEFHLTPKVGSKAQGHYFEFGMSLKMYLVSLEYEKLFIGYVVWKGEMRTS